MVCRTGNKFATVSLFPAGEPSCDTEHMVAGRSHIVTLIPNAATSSLAFQAPLFIKTKLTVVITITFAKAQNANTDFAYRENEPLNN